VVAQQILLRDGLAQGQHLVALPLCQLKGRPVAGVGSLIWERASIGRLRKPIDGLA